MDRTSDKADFRFNPAILERALDVMSSAVLLIGPNAEILWANKEGHNLLSADDGLGRAEVAAAVGRLRGKEADAVITTVPRPSGRKPYQMAIVPVPPSTLVFMHDPETPRRCCTEALR